MFVLLVRAVRQVWAEAPVIIVAPDILLVWDALTVDPSCLPLDSFCPPSRFTSFPISDVFDASAFLPGLKSPSFFTTPGTSISSTCKSSSTEPSAVGTTDIAAMFDELSVATAGSLVTSRLNHFCHVSLKDLKTAGWKIRSNKLETWHAKWNTDMPCQPTVS